MTEVSTWRGLDLSTVSRRGSAKPRPPRGYTWKRSCHRARGTYGSGSVGADRAGRLPVSDRGTLGGLTQFARQFGCRADPLARKPRILKTRRDVRVVEGARLESVCRGNSTEGSNPSLSANSFHCFSSAFRTKSIRLAFSHPRARSCARLVTFSSVIFPPSVRRRRAPVHAHERNPSPFSSVTWRRAGRIAAWTSPTSGCALLPLPSWTKRRKLSSDLFDRREVQRGFVLDGKRVPCRHRKVSSNTACIAFRWRTVRSSMLLLCVNRQHE